MKTMAFVAVAGFAGLATASPFFSSQSGNVIHSQPGVSPAGASATTTVNLTGAVSHSGLGSSLNEVYNVNLGANAVVTGIGWDLFIATIGGSWLSEARFNFSSTGDLFDGVALTPAVGETTPGSGAYTSGGIIDLTAIPDGAGGFIDLSFAVGADGILRIELYESFVDNSGTGDAFVDGTLTIQYTPAPSAMALLGLGGLVAGRRRR